MKRTRTPIPPIFQGPGSRSRWHWTATMEINSSGYVHRMHVTAARTDDDGNPVVGTAQGEVPPFIDVHEVLELLATEAMLASTEPTLWDGAPARVVDVSTRL